MKLHIKIILIAVSVLVLIVGGIVAFQLTATREVKSYQQGICQAFMPQCGVCPGEIKDAKCYVKRGTFEQYP